MDSNHVHPLQWYQQQLDACEKSYQLLFEKTPCGVLIYQDERIVRANSRAGEMLGCEAKNLEGRLVWDMILEEDRERIKMLAGSRLAQKETDLHYECRLKRQDRKTCWVDVASSITEVNGRTAVLVHAVDITDRKEAITKRAELSQIAREQEEQLVHSTRLAELGEMAAQVAHELNQPLTGIRNFAANALFMIENNVAEPDELKDNLHRITEQVDRASRIINRMRQLARKTERQIGPVDLNAVVSETMEFLTPQLKLSGVQWTTQLAPDLPKISGDRMRLEQVLLNLLTNARQAMEETHERHLTIKTLVCAHSTCPVTIEIADTGIGFAPEVAEKLFLPFFTTKKPGQGTGLGLSISLRIVKDHRGSIEAKGEPQRGATFTIRLPQAAEGEAKLDGPKD